MKHTCLLFYLLSLFSLFQACKSENNHFEVYNFGNKASIDRIKSQQCYHTSLTKVFGEENGRFFVKIHNIEDKSLVAEFNSDKMILNAFIYPSMIVKQSYMLVITTEGIFQLSADGEIMAKAKNELPIVSSEIFQSNGLWHILTVSQLDSSQFICHTSPVSRYGEISKDFFQHKAISSAFSSPPILVRSSSDITEIIGNQYPEMNFIRFRFNDKKIWEEDSPVSDLGLQESIKCIGSLDLNNQLPEEVIFSHDTLGIGILDEQMQQVVAYHKTSNEIQEGLFKKIWLEDEEVLCLVYLAKIKGQDRLSFKAFDLLKGEVYHSSAFKGRISECELLSLDYNYDGNKQIILNNGKSFFLFDSNKKEVTEFGGFDTNDFKNCILTEIAESNFLFSTGIQIKGENKLLVSKKSPVINMGLSK